MPKVIEVTKRYISTDASKKDNETIEFVSSLLLAMGNLNKEEKKNIKALKKTCKKGKLKLLEEIE